MATTCTNCGCASSVKCGCQDTMLTSPAPCPSPVGCLAPEPCAEVLDAQCIIYTGDPLTCVLDTVVASNTSVADALANIVDYFCNNVTPGASEYLYIDSFFATYDTFISNTNWHVPSNYAGFVYTAAYTGKYKITLTTLKNNRIIRNIS